MVISDTLDLTQHFSITSSDKVSKIIAPLTNAFDIKHFRYLKLYPNGSRILLSNYADCTRFYYEEGHYKKMWYDGASAKYLIEGWHIWDMMRIIHSGGEISPLEKEINQLLNLYHGMTFITKGMGFYEIYTFDGDNPHIYQIDKKVLTHFILYFKEQAKKLLAYGEKEKIIIPFKQTLDENDLHHENDKITAALKNMPINRYYLSGKYEGAYLTAKEVQCIYWLLQGKSAEEIAAIEGNSTKTIESHLENARRRLNCYKQTQLVRIILESGILILRGA